MGVVYRAFDTLMKRDVALKTIIDIDNPATLQLFYKEWSILATMVHPNVVNIYDIGEFQQNGVKQPFFVMPLLPGVTLDRLIKEGSPKLSVTGTLEIIEQACRGLHAAHEQGLVHRDVKPSNIFVMDDNSVKIIDFGIARQAAANAKTSVRGTLYYLAPEQLQLQPPTPLSDLFALAVVTYEALTRRRPFTGASEHDVVEAIRHYSPPPVSEINSDVSYLISQVVHKGMAKQPWHRFFNMREFGDSLQKALRNEPLECFDTTKIKPRLERAASSFGEGDYVFASEVLAELEAEGHLDQSIAMLRRQVDQAVRQTRIRQMLGSARRFFEATEYPLALRKIQEALELDPEDLDALSLKDQVEKQRRARKISEWIALGRQHLDNSAFQKAREALENVVQIKPNDTEALGLLAEVSRREQEVSRVRDEKSRLYQAAMNAWEKGEVTSALSRLEVLIAMDRDQPETDSGRSSTYQSFYNQVHSEHNSLKSAYEEARRNLANDQFEAASAACKQYLSKYPNHALFQALQFDVEERQRQKLSGVIAETDRRAEAEPDLDRRSAILEEALKLYPGEPHFERSARLVRDKRDLVNSIVAKARFFEDRGQFNEALDQWQILRSIHEKQPGLAFEIQRLIQRRDQQARENTKSRWVEQADKYLEGGDYERAMQTVRGALAEFPGEAELLELEKLVRKNQERAGQALELLEKARDLGEKGEAGQALDLLREACQMDSRNTVIRTVLINSLLERARRLVDSDCEAADGLVREVLELEPKHAPALSLASRIGDRKRDDFIAWCLAQARRLQTEGDLDGALAVAGQGLAAYPNESRLQQLQATLQRAQMETTRSHTRSREVVEAAKPEAAEAPSPAKPAQPATQALQPQALQPQALQPQALQPEALQPAASAGNTPGADQPAPSLLTSPELEETIVLPPAPTPKSHPPMPPQRRMMLQAALACLAVLVVVIAGTRLARRREPIPPPAPARFKVMLSATPAGAELSVNGKPCGITNCDLDLGEGSFQAEAKLAGYRPATAAFTTAPGALTAPIELKLEALGPRVSLLTDFSDGTIQLDGGEAIPLQGGAWELASLTPGTHEFTVKSGSAAASLSLEIAAGAMPSLNGSVRANNLRGFVLLSSGSAARLVGSMTGFRVTLDGKLIGNLGPGGVEFHDLAAGSHEVLLDGPTGQHDQILFETQPTGAIYVSLMGGANMGVLSITGGDDGAQVFINGVKYQRATKQGRLLIYLPPKKYTIRMQKEGTQPAELQVELRAFQETRAEFKLAPQPATLQIHHAPPSSEVWVDGLRAAVTRADGEFTLSLPPGRHALQLRHDSYKPLQAELVLAAGRATELEGAMESLAQTGTLRIDVTPAEARLRIRREGETRDRDVASGFTALPEGNYTLSASAARYQDGGTTVHVAANRTVTASLALKPLPTRIPQPVLSGFALDDWQKTGGWTNDGGALHHTGGEIVPAPVEFTQARIRFTILQVKGRRTGWILGLRDSKDYWLFQLDGKNYTRTAVVNGKSSEQMKTAHGLDRKLYSAISIDVTPTAIVHSALRGRDWMVLEKWEFPEGAVRGKFAFLVPGRDEISLKEFSLTH